MNILCPLWHGEAWSLLMQLPAGPFEIRGLETAPTS